MATDNTKLNARIVVLVFTILSVVELIFQIVYFKTVEGTIEKSAIVAYALSLLPKLILIVYAAFLSKSARILPFIAIALLTALNAFRAIGGLADYLQLLANGEAAFGESGLALFETLVFSALSALALVLLIIGCWKSFQGVLFSIVPVFLLVLVASVSVGINAVYVAKPLIDGAESVSYASNAYVETFFGELSNLFFYLGIAIFVLKNRTFSVRANAPEVAAEPSEKAE